ncbi:MAG: sensor histidine kinase [Ilumatobacteraceae bacterium]
MELIRAANPLQTVLRIAFVAVVCAAAIVDLWVIGNRWLNSIDELRPTLLIVMGIAAIGVAWALWPKHVVVLSLAASWLSLMASTRGRYHGLQIGIFTEFVVLPVLFAALLSWRGVARWPTAAIVVIAGEATSQRVHDTSIKAIIAMAMLVLFGAAATAVVYMRLRDSERLASVEQARHSERLDLARELHDVVGHHVTGIVVLAQASRFTNGAPADSPAERALAQIEAAGLETLTSVRRLIGLLRTDPTTASGPRLADIERIVEDLRLTHPLAELVVDDAVRAGWVAPDLANTVQRLVQESATNVRRHGDPASPVRFSLGTDRGALLLTVTNRMLHQPSGEGYGLVGMRERVDALGGAFTAGPAAQEWVVRAELPLSVGVG